MKDRKVCLAIKQSSSKKKLMRNVMQSEKCHWERSLKHFSLSLVRTHYVYQFTSCLMIFFHAFYQRNFTSRIRWVNRCPSSSDILCVGTEGSNWKKCQVCIWTDTLTDIPQKTKRNDFIHWTRQVSDNVSESVGQCFHAHSKFVMIASFFLLLTLFLIIYVHVWSHGIS